MKSFKEYILESPEILNTPRNTWNSLYKKSREYIKSNHSKSENIGNNYFHNIINSNHVYYRNEGEEVKEVSIINKEHHQISIDKGIDGDAEHIKNFMKYHAEKHGVVKSDKTQSLGAIHLWKKLIKSEPTKKHFYHVNGENKIQLKKDNIDKLHDDIWNKNKSNTYIEMRHNE